MRSKKNSKNMFDKVFEGIKKGKKPIEIAKDLNTSKQKVNYYIRKLVLNNWIKKENNEYKEIRWDSLKKKKEDEKWLGSFYFDKNGNLRISDKKSLRECYFCGFDELVQKHHIIRKKDGGTDENDNIIFLCPNHHYLIHSRLYSLGMSKGIYLLKNNETGEIVVPINYKEKERRKLPKCMRDNPNLLVKGDPSYKAKIYLKEDYEEKK